MTTVHVPSPVQRDRVKRGLDELIICRQFANRFEDSQVKNTKKNTALEQKSGRQPERKFLFHFRR